MYVQNVGLEHMNFRSLWTNLTRFVILFVIMTYLIGCFQPLGDINVHLFLSPFPSSLSSLKKFMRKRPHVMKVLIILFSTFVTRVSANLYICPQMTLSTLCRVSLMFWPCLYEFVCKVLYILQYNSINPVSTNLQCCIYIQQKRKLGKFIHNPSVINKNNGFHL